MRGCARGRRMFPHFVAPFAAKKCWSTKECRVCFKCKPSAFDDERTKVLPHRQHAAHASHASTDVLVASSPRPSTSRQPTFGSLPPSLHSRRSVARLYHRQISFPDEPRRQFCLSMKKDLFADSSFFIQSDLTNTKYPKHPRGPAAPHCAGLFGSDCRALI